MTTPSTEQLLDLAARCEAAEGPDRELDRDIATALICYPPPKWRHGEHLRRKNAKPYTASLDAAMTLVPEGFVWTVYGGYARAPDSAEVGREPTGGELVTPVASADAATAALALTAAALRSLAEEGEGE